MSVQELEERVKQLPPEDLRRFAQWWEGFRETSLAVLPLDDAVPPEAESEAVKAELVRRQREYREHPERFVHPGNAEDLGRFFEEIRREVAARVPSTRQG